MGMILSRTEHRELVRPEGRICYTVAGDGPLVLAVPGMGDTGSSYRELLGPLVEQGYRVAVTELRGHGGSGTGFSEYGDRPTAGDLLALIDELGGPAVVVANSMAAAAAVLAAADRPGAIAAIVGVGPLLREHGGRASAPLLRLMFRVLFARPWGVGVWASYYRGQLNRGAKAPWLAEHVDELRAMLRAPGALAALRRLAVSLDHSEAGRAVEGLSLPMLHFIGALDPDYPDPAAERDWIASLGATAVLVPEAAHYPHAQRPDLVVPVVLDFLGRQPRSAKGWSPHA